MTIYPACQFKKPRISPEAEQPVENEITFMLLCKADFSLRCVERGFFAEGRRFNFDKPLSTTGIERQNVKAKTIALCFCDMLNSVS